MIFNSNGFNVYLIGSMLMDVRINFTRTVDLTMTSSNQVDDSIITDRYCMQILPRIYHYVKCLIVQGCFLECVLHASSYPNLFLSISSWMWVLVFSMLCHFFFSIFKKQNNSLYLFLDPWPDLSWIKHYKPLVYPSQISVWID
jgi:hypothetical protein